MTPPEDTQLPEEDAKTEGIDLRRMTDEWICDGNVSPQAVIDLRDALTAARAEVERLQNTDQRVPGMWGCRTCGFVQMRSILYAGNGAIGANTETLMEPCPNDGDVMFPYTYKQLAKENQEAGEAAIIRARGLDEEVASLRAENERLRDAVKHIRNYTGSMEPGCYFGEKDKAEIVETCDDALPAAPTEPTDKEQEASA